MDDPNFNATNEKTVFHYGDNNFMELPGSKSANFVMSDANVSVLCMFTVLSVCQRAVVTKR